MKRSISLTAIGVLLFLLGLSAIVSDCLRTHRFELAPSLNLFNLIAGVGLLKFWRVARWYALFIFGSAFFVGLPMMIWAAFNSHRIVFQFPSILIDDRPHVITPLFLVILAMLGYVAVSGWSVFILVQPGVRNLFYRADYFAEGSAAA